jgi:hypothetical protein
MKFPEMPKLSNPQRNNSPSLLHMKIIRIHEIGTKREILHENVESSIADTFYHSPLLSSVPCPFTFLSLSLRLFLVHSVRSFVRSFVLLSVSLGNNSTISNFSNKTHPITQINFRSCHKRSVLPVYYRESAVTSLYKVTIRAERKTKLVLSVSSLQSYNRTQRQT